MEEWKKSKGRLSSPGCEKSKELNQRRGRGGEACKLTEYNRSAEGTQGKECGTRDEKYEAGAEGSKWQLRSWLGCTQLGRRELMSCLQHTGRKPAGKISEKLMDSLNACFQAGSAAHVSSACTSCYPQEQATEVESNAAVLPVMKLTQRRAR